MQVVFDPDLGWSATPEIPYRGSRTYLHGTDLYVASSAIVGAAVGESRMASLDVRYPRFTRFTGELRLVAGEAERAKWAASPVRIQASMSDGRIFKGWYEETATPASGRSDNCEKDIVAATVIKGSTAKYMGEPGPPPIEIVVFLTKTLLQRTFPDGPGKWVFTALRSQAALGETAGVEVTLATGDGAKACCSVMNGGQKFGDIYFGRADE